MSVNRPFTTLPVAYWVRSACTGVTSGIRLYCVANWGAVAHGPHLVQVRLCCMMGAKAIVSWTLVVSFKNWMTASFWPVRIFQTSEKVRFLMAAMKMGLVLLAAAAAPDSATARTYRPDYPVRYYAKCWPRARHRAERECE